MAHNSAQHSITLKTLFPAEELGNLAFMEVGVLRLNSLDVKPGDCFVAVSGERVDGRNYIENAIAAGAALVLSEADGTSFSVDQKSGVSVVHVPALKDRLSELAGHYYDDPSKKLKVVGITGTNGKTTCSQWLAQLLMLLGNRAATVGTLGYGVAGESIEYTGMTTPDAVKFQEILADFVQSAVSTVVAEVSSHSLVMGRVAALDMDVAVVTNISRDHLDFHGAEENYVSAKLGLMKFKTLRSVVLNKDDAYFEAFSRALINERSEAVVVSTSLQDSAADFYCSNIELNYDGVSATLHTPQEMFDVRLPLWGEFNLANVLSVVAAATALDYQVGDIIPLLESLPPVAGRMEPVKAASDISVIVDFAHTPDALSSVLSSIKKHTNNNVWCVFGCGGDRDSGKRPLMAKEVERIADYVVVTSDNPRGEAPESIIEDVCQGLSDKEAAYVIPDRGEAIDHAISSAKAGDIVVLAGKGHEEFQHVGIDKLPFSDFSCARLALQKRMEAAL